MGDDLCWIVWISTVDFLAAFVLCSRVAPPILAAAEVLVVGQCFSYTAVGC
jgi:hypothetical protein